MINVIIDNKMTTTLSSPCPSTGTDIAKDFILNSTNGSKAFKYDEARDAYHCSGADYAYFHDVLEHLTSYNKRAHNLIQQGLSDEVEYLEYLVEYDGSNKNAEMNYALELHEALNARFGAQAGL